MNIDVSVDGRPWNVTVEPGNEGGQFAVTIKGLRRVIDVSWIDADTLSLVDGTAVHDVRIHRRANGALGVEFGGRLYEAAVKQARERLSGRDVAKTPPESVSIPIKAPMPGRVVRVLVAVGDRVVARQGVVVVEAMKMENELRAPRDGTVLEIKVAPGGAVESGAVLVVIS